MRMQVILGCLPFTPKNRKFRLENQMVRHLPFGTFRKKWAVVRGDPLFPLFSVFPVGVRTIRQYPFGFDCFLCGENKMAAKDKGEGR